MVGRLIRDKRLAKGLSQEMLAKELVVDHRQVVRWEGYTTQLPRKATRQRIGGLLDIADKEWHLAAARAAEEASDVAVRTERAEPWAGPSGESADADVIGPPSPDDPLELMMLRVRQDADLMRQLAALMDASTPELREVLIALVAAAWRENLRMNVGTVRAVRGEEV